MPLARSAVLCDAAGPQTRDEIFTLLTHPEARPFRLSSGDVDRDLRLLAVGRWLLKAHSDRKVRDFHSLLTAVTANRQFDQAVGVAHPEKQWFVVFDGSECWLCNCTPKLRLVSELRGLDYVGGRVRVLLKILSTLIRRRLVLDVNPGNYGAENGRRGILYVDDEIYVRRKGRLELASPWGHL